MSIFHILGNWSSLSRRIAQETGKTVITFDARNHGLSDHHESMSYQHMSEDMKSIITEDKITLIGHSMGGRTCMYFALKYPEIGMILDRSILIQKIIPRYLANDNIGFI